MGLDPNNSISEAVLSAASSTPMQNRGDDSTTGTLDFLERLMTMKTENWCWCFEKVRAEGQLGSLVRTPPTHLLSSLLACRILRA